MSTPFRLTEKEEKYQKYIDYIKNTGGNPAVEWFDEDWEPIGPMVRTDMIKYGLIVEVNGKIELTD